MNAGNNLNNYRERERETIVYFQREEIYVQLAIAIRSFMHRPNIFIHAIDVLAKVIVEGRKCSISPLRVLPCQKVILLLIIHVT